jgi:hypothetical protein
MPTDTVLPATVKRELDQLIAAFFRAVSFSSGAPPPYGDLHRLFVENGLLIKNSSATPEIATVSQFIESRAHMVRSGELTAFREVELAEITERFGNVAHRFSTYEKSGTLNGAPFVARGVISTQFIMTPDGWKISAMAWDDERPGLTIPHHYQPAER